MQQPRNIKVEPNQAFVVSDFDGTLSPIVSDPRSAVFEDGAIEALLTLVDRYKTVGILSGRSSDFIKSQIDWCGQKNELNAKKLKIYGFYGNEEFSYDKDVLNLVASMADEFKHLLPASVYVEYKFISVTLHYRNDESQFNNVKAISDTILLKYTDFECLEGKKSIEIVPKTFRNKGDVIRDLLKTHQGGYYLGDDLGDIQAFKVLKANSNGTTCAVGVKSLDTPNEVVETVDLLLEGTKQAVTFLRGLGA